MSHRSSSGGVDIHGVDIHIQQYTSIEKHFCGEKNLLAN